MRRKTAQIFAVIALAGAALAGITLLVQQHAQQAESFPPFSSFRTLPEGASILYESLRRSPGMTAERNIQPIGTVRDTDAAILMLDIAPLSVNGNDDFFNDVDELASRGNRVIIGLSPHRTRFTQPNKDELEDTFKRWNIRLDFVRQIDMRDDEDEALIAGWPMYFSKSPGWNATRKEHDRAVVIERPFGKGAIVLLANSFLLSNAAMVEDRQTSFLASLIGPMHRTVFDETHFGMEETGSIAGLARHYRLQGLVLGLVLTASLFIWKSAAGFPPPRVESTGERASVMGEDSAGAFLNLLRRNIRRNDIIVTCVEQWRKMFQRTAGPGLATIVDLAERGRATPVETYAQIQQVLIQTGRHRPERAKQISS
jgi:hypothetical protein